MRPQNGISCKQLVIRRSSLNQVWLYQYTQMKRSKTLDKAKWNHQISAPILTCLVLCLFISPFSHFGGRKYKTYASDGKASISISEARSHTQLYCTT